MREIIFRARRKDNGEWAYGFPFVGETSSYILYAKMSSGSGSMFFEFDGEEVFPETVGQYTGLKDKNGKRIFEGDILLLDDIKGLVNYGTGCFCVELPGPDYLYRNNPAIDMVLNEYPGLEIIGNAHDNPEIIDKE